MSDAVTQFSTISTDAPNVWISERMYTLAERRLQVGQWAQKYTQPKRMGKTLRVVRYRRLTLPRNTLTEGVAPDAVALAIDNVDVTVEQWGIVVLITDVGLITTKHPALNIAIQRTALAMAEVLEREMCVMLMGGTNVYYAGTATTRPTLVAGNVINTSLILQATTFLRAKGAPDWDTGLFGGVMPPQGESDVIKSDQTFQNAMNYANVKVLQYAEIGVWGAVRWTRGNFLPFFAGVAAPDTAAATATKSQVTASASGGSLATGNYQVVVVARDTSSYYERRVSQNSANIAVTGPTGSIAVALPTSLNYVYDVYMSNVGTTAPLLIASAQAGATTYTITAQSTVTTAPPAAPASGTETFLAWVFGQDGFGRVELSGMSLQSFITPPGASYSNPLAQGRKVGSKVMWKSFIQEQDFFVRLEFTSSFSAFLAA